MSARLFETERGIAAPLPLANIDTDQIIPARFLKTVSRDGLADGLFYAMRFDERGAPRAGFVLDRPGYRDATILLTLENFGCGSSREHAPWALLERGFRAIIAPSFADIFAANAARNGLLLVTLPRAQCDQLLADAVTPGFVTIDLPTQQVVRADGTPFSFEIAPTLKRALRFGLDEIAISLERVTDIEAREDAIVRASPWLRPRTRAS